MNLDRYEKIDGREALKRLADGEEIFSKSGSSYFLRDESNHLWLRTTNSMGYAGISVCEMLTDSWYIPKPFDVRQAMLDRPNEWVGAYKSGMGFWFKIGFDTDSMNAVYEELELDGLPFWQHNRVRPSMLKASIPIEDVPEEATR